MKSYTDIEQSKKLSQILPLESADMRYHTISHLNTHPCNEIIYTVEFGKASGYDVPCWSLTALLNVLPDAMLCKDKKECALMVETIGSGPTIFGSDYVDVCYEMILKLHE